MRPPKKRFKPKGLASFNKLLGSWFDVFPFALSEIGGGLQADEPELADLFYSDDSYYNHDGSHPAPPFTLTDNEREDTMRSFRDDINVQILEHNTRAEAFRDDMCLESTQESTGLGGVCHLEVGFSNTLQRYFGELLVEDVGKGDRDSQFVNAAKGITSAHRSMRKQGAWPLLSDRGGFHYSQYSEPDPKMKYDLCYLQPNDRPLAYSLQESCKAILDGTSSMAGITAHMENLSHDEVPLR